MAPPRRAPKRHPWMRQTVGGSRAIPVRSMSSRERARWGGCLASTRRPASGWAACSSATGTICCRTATTPAEPVSTNLLVIDLGVDLDKAAGIPGAKVGAALLRFDGQPTNQQAGVATGYTHADIREPDDPGRAPRLLQLGLRHHRDHYERAILRLARHLRRQRGARRARRADRLAGGADVQQLSVQYR